MTNTTQTTGGYFAIGTIATGLVNKLIAFGPAIHVVVEILVGLSAILTIYFLIKNKKTG